MIRHLCLVTYKDPAAVNAAEQRKIDEAYKKLPSIIPGILSMEVGRDLGLLEGNARQVLIQFYAVIAVVIWSGVLTYVLLKAIELFLPLRVSAQHEIEGLDLSQHGEALQ